MASVPAGAMLRAVIVVAWALWAVGSLLHVKAEKLQRTLPPEAHVSAFPVIPLFPLLLLGSAYLIDAYARTWGTWIIGGLHVLLIAASGVGILYELRRIYLPTRRPE